MTIAARQIKGPKSWFSIVLIVTGSVGLVVVVEPALTDANVEGAKSNHQAVSLKSRRPVARHRLFGQPREGLGRVQSGAKSGD
jgi:hypothetical protein